jgi:hypothetical protein
MADDRAADRIRRRKKSFLHRNKKLQKKGTGGGEGGCAWVGRRKPKRNAPASPSARKQVRDGTGETASLVLLHGIPRTDVRSLPGISLLSNEKKQ